MLTVQWPSHLFCSCSDVVTSSTHVKQQRRILPKRPFCSTWSIRVEHVHACTCTYIWTGTECSLLGTNKKIQTQYTVVIHIPFPGAHIGQFGIGRGEEEKGTDFQMIKRQALLDWSTWSWWKWPFPTQTSASRSVRRLCTLDVKPPTARVAPIQHRCILAGTCNTLWYPMHLFTKRDSRAHQLCHRS